MRVAGPWVPLVLLLLLVLIAMGCDDTCEVPTAPDARIIYVYQDAARDAEARDAEARDAEPDAEPDAESDSVVDAEIDAEIDAALPDAWVRPARCDEPVVSPLEAQIEFESDHAFAEGDMAFDGAGQIAAIDARGDLYRVGQGGRRTLWARGVARTPRGIAFLSTGELVVADSGRGMLVLVYPGGEVRTLVEHLDAPFGLDVDHDDFIYVSEATRGAISRVDPRTGDIARIADGLSFSPMALALSPDDQILYVSGRRSGAVHALDRGEDGHFGQPRVFAVLPSAWMERPALCGDARRSGDEECDDGNDALGDGCDPDCTFDPYNGVVDAAGGIYDLVFDEAGTARIIFTTDAPGDIDAFAFTLLEPSALSIHTINLPGDNCSGDTFVDLYRAGEDAPYATNDDDPQRVTRYCSRLDPHDLEQMGRVPAGDYVIRIRQYSDQQIEREGNWLVVQTFYAVPGIGDACESEAEVWGRCPEGSYCGGTAPDQICLAHVCGDGVVADDEQCDDGNEVDDDGCDGGCSFSPYNAIADAADEIYNLEFDLLGVARVIFTTDTPGDVDRFAFTLAAPSSVEIRTIDLAGDGCSGDTVVEIYAAGAEAPFAVNDDDPVQFTRYCSRLRPLELPAMADLPAGDYIVLARQFSAESTELQGNWLVVELLDDEEAAAPAMAAKSGLVGDCNGRSKGTLCRDATRAVGRCVPEGVARLRCELLPSCEGAERDALCATDDDRVGTCHEIEDVLSCVASARCEANEHPCEVEAAPGVCVEGLRDALYCRTGSACDGADEGDACQSSRTQGPGRCWPRLAGVMVCQPESPCAEIEIGALCSVRDQIGNCRDDAWGGEVYCDVEVEGADIVALETDTCGHVYVGDEVSESVWRIGSDGEEIVRFAALHRGVITSLAFGPGAGGFDHERLYIGGQGGADLLSVEVGHSGRPMVYPMVDDVVPAGPEDPNVSRCLNIPEAPVQINELDRPRGYHDVALDQDGYIVGFDRTALVRVNAENQLQPYAAGLSEIENLDWLPDGSLIVASAEGLVRIWPNGAQQVLAPDVHAYGVTVGPAGQIYAGDNDHTLWRVDPETGQVDAFLDTTGLGADFKPRTIAFDLDASLMYIGTFGAHVYVMTLDEYLEPVGVPRYFTTIRDGVIWVDGLAVDACGNLYIPNYETSRLYRAAPDGEIEVYIQWTYNQYGHNVTWGSGVGGWRTDALYLPQPYDGSSVVEVVVGVEGHVP